MAWAADRRHGREVTAPLTRGIRMQWWRGRQARWIPRPEGPPPTAESSAWARARAAFLRGDRWFEFVAPIGRGADRTDGTRPSQADLICEVENQGWHLRHVGYVDADAMAATAAGSAPGRLAAIYLFQRAKLGPPTD